MPESALLGMDIGGTNIRMVLGDRDGFITNPSSFSTADNWSPEGLSELVRQELEDYPHYEVEAAGIGVAGIVDTGENRMLKATQVNEISFDQFQQDLDVPVYLENDANVAALGEKMYGKGDDADNLVTLIMGSGIGAGVFYDGELLASQKNGGSPEPGFMIIEDGNYWEELCGGEEIPNYINQKLEEESQTELSRISSAEDLFAQAEQNEVAEKYVDELADLNARGVASMINCYAPEVLAVTGSVALENPDFIKDVFEKVEEEEYAINSVPEMYVSDLGDNLGLYGSLALAQSNLK